MPRANPSDHVLHNEVRESDSSNPGCTIWRVAWGKCTLLDMKPNQLQAALQRLLHWEPSEAPGSPTVQTRGLTMSLTGILSDVKGGGHERRLVQHACILFDAPNKSRHIRSCVPCHSLAHAIQLCRWSAALYHCGSSRDVFVSSTPWAGKTTHIRASCKSMAIMYKSRGFSVRIVSASQASGFRAVSCKCRASTIQNRGVMEKFSAFPPFPQDLNRSCAQFMSAQDFNMPHRPTSPCNRL